MQAVAAKSAAHHGSIGLRCWSAPQNQRISGQFSQLGHTHGHTINDFVKVERVRSRRSGATRFFLDTITPGIFGRHYREFSSVNRTKSTSLSKYHHSAFFDWTSRAIRFSALSSSWHDRISTFTFHRVVKCNDTLKVWLEIYYKIAANLLLSSSVKEFWKSLNICQSYA